MIFDLWETLVDWDREASDAMLAAVAERAELPLADFLARWHETGVRYVGPIRDALRGAGIPAEAIEDVWAIRLDYTRQVLVPRPGAVETLQELRRRGKRLGLISVCTEEVERLWPEGPFAGLFGAAVFSSTAGLAKPDVRAYTTCCVALGVEPHEAVFVGDGANDELAGAERAGLRAVLIHRPGEDPPWPGLTEWDGPRITSVPEILNLV